MEAVLHDFYEHLKLGEILGQKCEDCGAVTFPPRNLCASCGSSKTRWVKMSGKGRLLYASAGVHLMTGIPFVLGTVRLDEGPLVPAVLLEDDFDFSRPEAVWDLSATNGLVQAEVVQSLSGEGVMVAFRRVRNS